MSPITPNQWQSLSPYLDKALEMSEQERLVWLTSLLTEDPDLAREIEMLLQEHVAASAEKYLEKSVPHWSGLAGQEVGVYTLISQIGQGGMGSVWLAERNDGRFERRVAVKLLNISLMGAAGEALALLQEGLQLGTFSCVRGRAFLALGRALQAQNKSDQAHAAFRSAAENLQSTVGPNHPDTRNAQQMSESQT